ncbi:hypothetical protein ACJQWK_11317 [Exserohilum turcicum]
MAIRNEMLSQQRQADWLFTKLNEVMIEECYRYRKNEQPQLDSLFDAKQWEQLVNTAQSKIRTTNPFYLVDLEHLAAWTGKTDFEKKGRRAYTLKYETIAESDLPVDYVLDRFGVIAATACQSAPPTFTVTELEVPYHPKKVADIFRRSTTTVFNSHLSQRCARNWKALRLLLVQGCCVLTMLSLLICTNIGDLLYSMCISLIEKVTQSL